MSSNLDNVMKTVLSGMVTGVGLGIGLWIVKKVLATEATQISQAPAAGYTRGGRGRSEEDLEST